jgi:DNA-binding HxlR family transcriptional regulator
MPVVLDGPFGRPIDPHDVVYVAKPTLKAQPTPSLRRMSASPISTTRPTIHRSVEIVGDYWSWAVVGCAFLRIRRFDEMLEATGMAPNVLSDRLARLGAAGVVRRTQYCDSPPRYEYRLTRAGLALHPMVMAMHGWSERWLCGIDNSPVELYRRGAGTRMIPVVCDAQTGRPIRAYDVRWQD